MQARTLPARQGLTWLKASFALYRRNPPLVTSAAMACLLAAVILGILPFIGPFLSLLMQPVLGLLMANVFACVDSERSITREALIEGVAQRHVALLQLGGLQLIMSVILTLISALLLSLLGVEAPTSLDKVSIANGALLLLPVIIQASLMGMVFWFAPILVGWHGLPPLKAMFFSFISIKRNFGAFVAHFFNCFIVVMASGLLLTLGTLVAPGIHDALEGVLRFVLLIVMAPVFMASSYISYQAIFHVSVEVD